MELITAGSRVEHPRYGEGIVSRVGLTAYEVFFAHGGKVDILKSNRELSVVQAGEEKPSVNVDVDDLSKAIATVLDQYGLLPSRLPMAPRWVGGSLIIKAAGDDLQPKEIPIDTFFHKIVMLRDRLRVLEQNINSHEKLTDEEKVQMQQYITRAYGSLTTFNVLFADKKDHFVGAKKEG
ncbi:MAG: hypothetical protein JXR39_03805 [Marinilabiliaceae bacterium]|nr:hypothetical protein [Marinilabiliaceae bacterium]